MSRLTRDGTAELVSRDEILRRERGHGKFHFSLFSSPRAGLAIYPVDPYSAETADHTYIHHIESTHFGISHTLVSKAVHAASINDSSSFGPRIDAEALRPTVYTRLLFIYAPPSFGPRHRLLLGFCRFDPLVEDYIPQEIDKMRRSGLCRSTPNQRYNCRWPLKWSS